MKNIIQFIQSKWEQCIVLIGLLLYAIAASLVSLHRYWQFDAFWYDFGIFDETVWQLSRFTLPIIRTLSSPIGKVVWADHLNPSIILISPLYWFTSQQEAMFVLQVVWVVVSAWVSYLIVRREIKNPWVRIALLVSYLGFVGLQNALYTDVHNIVFATLPMMLMFWSIYVKKWNWYFVFLLIFLGIQENMAAVGVGVGLFLLLRNNIKHTILRNWKMTQETKIGGITIFISLLWGILAYYVIIPYFNHGPYKYQPDLPLVWYEWITRFFDSPDLKTKTMIVSLATFGFLPLLSLPMYPLIIEHFLERFVLNSAATRWDLGFHYNILLSPILFIGTLEAIKKLQEHKKAKKALTLWAVFTIGIVFFIHRFYYHGPLMLATHPVFYAQTERAQFLRDFEMKIPKEGILMTQNNIAAHFTHRPMMLLRKNAEELSPDVVALDLRPGQNANNFYPISYEDAHGVAASLSASPIYEKIEVTDTQFIFVKRH